jgi:hypothetical protein
MSTEDRIMVIRNIELDEGDNLLDILTKLPKNVSYTDLKLKTYADKYGDSDRAQVWFEYKSLETDEEYDTRIRLQKLRATQEEEREKRQLEYLKSKYG